MIQLKDISKVFGKKQALKHINYEFKSTGMYVILGPSGSGKSTLLSILGSLDKPSSGTMYVHGQSHEFVQGKKQDDYRSDLVAFVFQDLNLIESLSVYDNLYLALKNKAEHMDELMEAMLKSLDIWDIKDQLVNSLSGGEKQRVAIARAALKKARIILADEPTGNLDKKNGHIVFEKLRQLSKTSLVIIATHNERFASQYGDVILRIEDGEIIEEVQVNNHLNHELDSSYSLNKASFGFKRYFLLAKNELSFHKSKYLKIFLALIIASFGMFLSLSSRSGSDVLIGEITNNYLERFVRS